MYILCYGVSVLPHLVMVITSLILRRISIMRSMVYKSISVVLMIAVGMIIMAAHHENESQKKQDIFDRLIGM